MIGPIGSSGLFPFGGLTENRLGGTSAASPGADAAARRRFNRASVDLRRLLEEFRTELEKTPSSRSVAAVARSATDLGLSPVGSATTLTSIAEINATPTSFTPFGPSFSGASTSDPTITGIYDGSNGDDTLTFEVKKGGTAGGDKNLQVEVFDGSGSRIDRINIQPNTPADTEFTLDNGLVVSFAAGELIKDDVFTVQVSATVGSVVDPDNPFDGTRNQYANLEYGVTVGTGFFLVNDQVITVSASDSLNEVLDRITNSAAGVTAAFDSATERVVLTQKNGGSSYDIVLSGDTSGFLDATKLTGAVSVPGEDGSADEVALALVPELASIASGTLLVNGVGIDIDVNVDSLQDVLERITESAAGVTASLSAGAQRVTIAAQDRSAPLVLDDGETGFFAALAIDEGSYEPTRRRGGSSPRRLERIVRQVAAAFDDLFRAAPASSQGGRVTSDLFASIKKTAGENGERVRTAFGLSFDARPSSRHFLEFSDGSGNRFRTAARQDLDRVRDFFLESAGSNPAPLIDSLIERLETAESESRAQAPGPGALLDALI